MKKKNVVYIIGIVLFISFIAIDVFKVKEKAVCLVFLILKKPVKKTNRKYFN